MKDETYRATHVLRMWKPGTSEMKSYPYTSEAEARAAYTQACEHWPDWTIQLRGFDGRQLEYREASK